MAINFQRVAPLQSFKDEKLRQSGPFQRSVPPNVPLTLTKVLLLTDIHTILYALSQTLPPTHPIIGKRSLINLMNKSLPHKANTKLPQI